MKNILFLFFFVLLSTQVEAVPIPKDNKVSFDVVRKNKVIGNVTSTFNLDDDKLFLKTTVNIEVKVLFFPAYKFFQETTETWINNELIEVDGYTDFEDEREYFIKGKDINGKFIASGMDGELELNKSIITLNYWNKDILKQKEVFDTQKGIVRKIDVRQLENEEINISGEKIIAEKYLLNATKNPKDLGPFPEYTLWYYENELIKFQFQNWKDKKTITTIRNDWKK